MTVLDRLGFCGEVARMPIAADGGQEYRVAGIAGKLVSLVELLPQPILNGIMQLVIKNTVEIDGYGKQPPFAYGSEALVYRLMTPEPQVLKLFHKTTYPNIELAKRMEQTTILENHFGDMLVPHRYFLCDSPFRSGQTVVAAVQDWVEGNDFFDNPHAAFIDEVQRLRDGIDQCAAENNGQVPDLCGERNVVISDQGKLNIIDNSLVTPTNLRAQIYDLYTEHQNIVSVYADATPNPQIAA